MIVLPGENGTRIQSINSAFKGRKAAVYNTEETLGKRIAANRKRLGLTQDQLAEKIGITAQAVSKWENDLSCPDITVLPKLAEIFGITSDELLGIRKEGLVHTAEIVEDSGSEPDGFYINVDSEKDGTWEVKWDGGRKSAIGFALWVLLTGGLLLASGIMGWGANFWGILWPSGIALYGLLGVFPKFSFFRLGCVLFGGYYLLNNLVPDLVPLQKEYLLPIFLLLFGISLLAEALRKNRKPGFKVYRNGQQVNKTNGKNSHTKNLCSIDGETFSCSVAFGEETREFDLPRLSGGTADVSFGSLTIDMTQCEAFSPDCHIAADCSFGELTIRVPSSCRAEVISSTVFGSVDISGAPSPSPESTIAVSADANFGNIRIQYV